MRVLSWHAHPPAGGPRASPTQSGRASVKLSGRGLPLPPYLEIFPFIRRAGLGPAPTERPESFLYFVGAGVLTRPPVP